MYKKISYTVMGQRADIGEFRIYRIVGTQQVPAIGPIVFLDHAVPSIKKPGTNGVPNGSGAHPHRGIATFSYVISGEFEHFDSKGNHGIVGAGGAQWMKAGNGIIHDEGFSRSFQQSGGIAHMLQFWVNLPAKNKAEDPKYTRLDPGEIPEIMLPGEGAKLRILIGKYTDLISKIETYSPQFIYEIQLQPFKSCTLELEEGWETSAYITEGEAEIAGTELNSGVLALLEPEGGLLSINNNSRSMVRVFVFGGAKYEETIVTGGPFVMNSQEEIAAAYADYSTGKYGSINYKHH